MTPPQLSIVIVSWNVREPLLRCLQALPAAVEELSYEVIVVDNASEDGTVAAVQSFFPEVKVKVNQRNLFYAAAANQGLALANGSYILLMNPDMLPHPHSIARLLRYAEAHPRAGLLGPRIFDARGQDDWRTGREYPTPWSEFVDWSGLAHLFSFMPFLLKNRRLAYDRGQSSAVPLLSGACLLFPPQLPASLRQFDPGFLMYGEDIDLCRRIDRARLQKILVSDARMTHIGGASSKQQPVITALLAVVAMNRYFHQWDGRLTAWLHRALMGLISLTKTAVFCTGSVIHAQWRKRCRIYRRILNWAILGAARNVILG